MADDNGNRSVARRGKSNSRNTKFRNAGTLAACLP